MVIWRDCHLKKKKSLVNDSSISVYRTFLIGSVLIYKRTYKLALIISVCLCYVCYIILVNIFVFPANRNKIMWLI